MPTDMTDREMAHFAMSGAHTTMLREVIQHLLEEGLLDPAKAQMIVHRAVDENFPEDGSTGRLYELGRKFLEQLAKAYGSFPPYPENSAGDRQRG